MHTPRGFHLSLFSVVIGYLAWSADATAQTLPNATFSANYSAETSPSSNASSPGNYSITGPKPFQSSLQFQIVDTPTPSVSFSSSITNSASFGSGEQLHGNTNGAILAYYIEFAGPAGPVPVQVDAIVQGMTSALPTSATGAYLLASFFVQTNGGHPVFSDTIDILNSAGTATSYSGQSVPLPYSTATGISGSIQDTHTWTAQANVLYLVGLEINENSAINKGGGETITESALVDPTFNVTGPNASAYSVLTSPGIGNSAVTPVPEPASSALMMLGLLWLIPTLQGRRLRVQRN